MSRNLEVTSDAVRAALADYRLERETLLRRVQELAAGDSRIAAVWLFGSLGRGDDDELSDIDIVCAVHDDHLAALIAERHAFMGRAGELLLVQEAPQNAPPGGAYNMAVYAAETGSHTADFYWQPAGATRIPPQARLLFDRVGLPHADQPQKFDYQPVPKITPEEAANRAVQFFRVMVLIAAKYVARSPHEESMGLLKWVVAPLTDVERFVGQTPAADLSDLPHPSLADKVGILRDLTARMESLLPQIVAHGGAQPSDLLAHTLRYLDFVLQVTESRSAPHSP